MELFFYSCEKEAPFETLYESLDSSGKKLLISNHQRHIAQFETYKDRILDEAIGDTITDKKILAPRAVKDIFLEWFKRKYGNDAKFEESVFNAKDFYSHGADELNNFLNEIMSEVSLCENFFKCFGGQLRLFRKQVFSMFGDPMQTGISVTFIILIFLMILKHVSLEHDKMNHKVKEALHNNNRPHIEKLAVDLQNEDILDKDNPPLIVLTEISKAQDWGKKEESSQLTLNSQSKKKQAPPKRECYIVQQNDYLGSLTGKFYKVSNNERRIAQIKKASFREKEGKKGIYNTETGDINELNENITIKAFGKKIQRGWELVIPNATHNRNDLKKCQFTP